MPRVCRPSLYKHGHPVARPWQRNALLASLAVPVFAPVAQLRETADRPGIQDQSTAPLPLWPKGSILTIGTLDRASVARGLREQASVLDSIEAGDVARQVLDAGSEPSQARDSLLHVRQVGGDALARNPVRPKSIEDLRQ